MLDNDFPLDNDSPGEKFTIVRELAEEIEDCLLNKGYTFLRTGNLRIETDENPEVAFFQINNLDRSHALYRDTNFRNGPFLKRYYHSDKDRSWRNERFTRAGQAVEESMLSIEKIAERYFW